MRHIQRQEEIRDTWRHIEMDYRQIESRRDGQKQIETHKETGRDRKRQIETLKDTLDTNRVRKR